MSIEVGDKVRVTDDTDELFHRVTGATGTVVKVNPGSHVWKTTEHAKVELEDHPMYDARFVGLNDLEVITDEDADVDTEVKVTRTVTTTEEHDHDLSRISERVAMREQLRGEQVRVTFRDSATFAFGVRGELLAVSNEYNVDDPQLVIQQDYSDPVAIPVSDVTSIEVES